MQSQMGRLMTAKFETRQQWICLTVLPDGAVCNFGGGPYDQPLQQLEGLLTQWVGEPLWVPVTCEEPANQNTPTESNNE